MFWGEATSIPEESGAPLGQDTRILPQLKKINQTLNRVKNTLTYRAGASVISKKAHNIGPLRTDAKSRPIKIC